MAEANPANDASRKRKRQRRKNRKSKQLSPQQGHYADPLSPIASTPMKLQHAKSTVPYHLDHSKSTKSKHAPPSDARNENVSKSEVEEKLHSPRKLLEEYDQQDKDVKKPRAKKARTLNYDSASSEKQGESADTSASEDANDELFSPALRPPRASRSTSASPPNARARLESKFAHRSAQPDEKLEEEATEEEETVDAEEQDDEDATPLEQEFNPFYFMKTLPKYEDIVEGKRPISLPERSHNAPKICLVLDLDETLVHCSVDEVKNPHMQFPVTFNGVEYIVNVKKRPHMEYFLKRVSKLFEIVVFTASHKVYAEKLTNMLDPHRNLIKYRLYRDDCLDVFGNYLKDLNVLGRDLSKVVLVDNSPHAFGYQVNNGIPIETWYDDAADAELLNLLPFLESLVDVDDVRPIVEKQFQIQKLIDATPDEVV
ncbi:NLI interacting factor-like phosphatase domain-containing protein [Phytophthora infestans]|uniref:NLI interacting factor-like phosphatase domain-containing protein n=2 Tax=Phytophthora infestans TaxID=4787 RepID=A0A833WW64_PHYIN|nr:NLI interacting factor-like phosphatase domain-containing protein [Phytophthora infestans]